MDNDLLLRSHPTEIWMACDALFGDEPWLTWEPETLLGALEGEVSPEAEDKILAVQAVASNSNCALADAIALEKVVMAWCNCICVMDAYQPPYVEELCYTVRELKRLIQVVHGVDARDKIEFTGEIPGYVAATAKFRDWVVLPSELAFAQEALNSLTGIVPGSKLYDETRHIILQVTEVFSSLDKASAEDLLRDPEIEKLEKDTSLGADVVKRAIGALLYDPTLVAK